MRNRSEKTKIVLLRILLAVVAGSFLTGSCSDRKNKPDNKDLIPEKTLVSILADAYVADGLLMLPKIRNEYANRDSVENYINIIDGYGYSKEAMDRTMKYYFIRKPKKLIRIYDQALDKLSKLETRFAEEMRNTPPPFGNLWPGKPSYSLPDPKGKDSLYFDLELNIQRTYTLTFTVTLYPSDQSFNPHFTAYLCHPDSIETGKRVYFPAIDYINDGHPHTYTFVIETPDNSVNILRGCFYDYENYHNDWEKNVRIDDISLTFAPNPL